MRHAEGNSLRVKMALSLVFAVCKGRANRCIFQNNDMAIDQITDA